MSPWRVILSPTAQKAIAQISDTRMRRAVIQRIKELAIDPEKLGKALLGELAGLRSVLAAGQRWRILYRVDRGRALVLVRMLGLRRDKDRSDVYALAKRLIKLNLIR